MCIRDRHRAVSSIVSRQLRNTVMVGPSVYMAYNFSDFIPPLVAMGAEVNLYSEGRMSLEAFLKRKRGQNIRDILTHVYVPVYREARGYYEAFRETSGDFPLLNLAITCLDGHYRIVFGARPNGAFRARRAERFLEENTALPKDEKIRHALKCMYEEVPFGGNLRASARYRSALAVGMLRQGLEAVL